MSFTSPFFHNNLPPTAFQSRSVRWKWGWSFRWRRGNVKERHHKHWFKALKGVKVLKDSGCYGWATSLFTSLEKNPDRETHKKNERSEEYKWKQDSVYWKNQDTGGASCGRVRRVFIYTVGFMASCVCWMAREPSPPGQRKQHHFKLECPLRRQVSCQEVHGGRIPTKSTDLFPNNCCVHLSHSTGRPPPRYTGAPPVSPPTPPSHEPTQLWDQIEARYCQRRASLWYVTDLWGRTLRFQKHTKVTSWVNIIMSFVELLHFHRRNDSPKIENSIIP